MEATSSTFQKEQIEELKNETEFNYFFYEVPRIVDEKPREKQVFIVSEDEKWHSSTIEYLISSHLNAVFEKEKKPELNPIKKNTQKPNFSITTYSFQSALYYTNPKQKVTYPNNIINKEKLTDNLTCSEATKKEFLNHFIAEFKLNNDNHRKADIEGEDKAAWDEFVRMTLLDKIMKKIISGCKDADVYLILVIKPFLIRQLNDYINEFKLKAARSKVFFIAIGEFNRKQHLPFASELQNKYSTQPAKIPAHFYQQYVYGEEQKYLTEEYFLQDSYITRIYMDSYFNSSMYVILQDFQFNAMLESELPLMAFPWSVPGNDLRQGDIALSKEDLGNEIKVKYAKDVLIRKIININIDDTTDLFAGWVNQILVDYYYFKYDKGMIEILIRFLFSFMDKYLKEFQLSKVPEDVPIERMTVFQRAIAQSSNRFQYKIFLLVKSLRDLISSDTIGELSEEEARERLKIGTEIGKYHQRSLVMRGMDVEQFLKMKEIFCKELQKVKGSIHYESDQIRSIFSLETQKDIFLQDDIIEALEGIKSQYHLISAFPLVGLGISLERSNGSMINPYLAKVTDYAKINANVDTVSIQNTPEKELNLKAGFYIGAAVGNKDVQVSQYGFKEMNWTQYQPSKAIIKDLQQTQLFYYKSEILSERIDAVVPLFGPKDYDLRPLLSTQFFHVLMTFNVVHNVDTYYPEAYLALLANTLILFLNQIPRSSYILELLDKIYHSINIVYSHRPFFMTYAKLLQESPRLAMVSYHEGHPTICQDPSKALIVLFFLVKNGDITDRKQIKDILEAIMQEIVARGMKNLEKLHTFFGIVGYDVKVFQEIERDIVGNVIGDVKRFPTIRLMLNEVDNSLKNGKYFAFTKGCKLYINKEEFGFMNYGKLNFFQSMKTICQYFLPGEAFNGALLWIWLLHAQKYPNNYTRNSTEIQTNMCKVYGNIKKQKIFYFVQEESNKIAASCANTLAAQFKKEMTLLHIRVLPETEESILLKLTGIHLEQFKAKFNNVSNLARNTCLSPLCPFYLHKMSNIAEHVRDVDCVIPGFHKAVKMMRNRDHEAIYRAIKEGSHLDYANFIEYNKQKSRLSSDRVQRVLLTKQKEIFMDLIAELAASYKIICLHG